MDGRLRAAFEGLAYKSSAGKRRRLGDTERACHEVEGEQGSQMSGELKI